MSADGDPVGNTNVRRSEFRKELRNATSNSMAERPIAPPTLLEYPIRNTDKKAIHIWNPKFAYPKNQDGIGPKKKLILTSSISNPHMNQDHDGDKVPDRPEYMTII